MLTRADIEQHIANIGHETRPVEFKGPGSIADKHYLAKVVRGALSMANLRDGGHIVLGITEHNGRLVAEGLTSEQVSQWTDYDKVAAAFAIYADPPMSFETALIVLEDHVKLVVIQLSCFTDIPHLCAKSYNDGKIDILRHGALYVRNHRMPETSEVASHVEMREVLAIATQNALRSFVSTAQNAGLQLRNRVPDDDHYRQECAAAWEDNDYHGGMEGFWEVSFRPQSYQDERIDRAALGQAIMQSTVRFRGWPVPYVGSITNHQTSISGTISDSAQHQEQWRLFTSGQFIHQRILAADLSGTPDQIPVWEILFYLTEVVELAARLTSTMVMPPRIVIDAELHHVMDRQLVSGTSSRELDHTYKTGDDSLRATIDVSVSELLSNTRSFAVDMSEKILRGFGFMPASGVLAEYQNELLK